MNKIKGIQYFDRAMTELVDLLWYLKRSGYTPEVAFEFLGDPVTFLVKAIARYMEADGERLTDTDIEALYAEIDRRSSGEAE